jgi:hypothetical protein
MNFGNPSVPKISIVFDCLNTVKFKGISAVEYIISIKLFNPVSIYGVEKDKNFLDRICRSNSKFKEVNHKVFDLYVKFLQSKNISWLNNAEREAE